MKKVLKVLGLLFVIIPIKILSEIVCLMISFYWNLIYLISWLNDLLFYFLKAFVGCRKCKVWRNKIWPKHKKKERVTSNPVFIDRFTYNVYGWDTKDF